VSLPAQASCRSVVEFGGHIVEVAGAPIGIGRSIGEIPPRQQPIGIFDGRQMPCCAWATVVKPPSGRFGSMPNRTVTCCGPICAQHVAQLRSLTVTHGQPFPLRISKSPDQRLTGFAFQAGHASSILVTRSKASPLVNALSRRPSYSNTEMTRITRQVIGFHDHRRATYLRALSGGIS
jgi:hypothetical protein